MQIRVATAYSRLKYERPIAVAASLAKDLDFQWNRSSSTAKSSSFSSGSLVATKNAPRNPIEPMQRIRVVKRFGFSSGVIVSWMLGSSSSVNVMDPLERVCQIRNVDRAMRASPVIFRLSMES